MKLRREYQNLDLLLQGTQRENERCMAELERAKTREKLLEKELANLVGDNWQTNLGLSPGPAAVRSSHAPRMRRFGFQAETSEPVSPPIEGEVNPTGMQSAQLEHLENIRMLVLGMDQKLSSRADTLEKLVQRADSELVKVKQASVALQGS
ncbi:hypothetical protein SISNIDRAFT_455158 [Sistotremastrum niveocremeum HHB9708]|uniref:Uncharacterized protein n=1 Tax=Sistotremastrum niveocremeum HHB9708 TaxID=1314777 RepID=A0A164UFB9_9AGAM|nr:hypothetical protein SISNIDRAFT_455158 [Sistotremastrum niveocremeum HHB9708]